MQEIQVKGYTIYVEHKNIKNMYLKVKKNGDILVSAPNKVSLAQVEKFILTKLSWLSQKVNQLPKQKSTDVHTFKLLGAQVQIVEAVGVKTNVKLTKEALVITSPKKLDEAKKQQLLASYAQQLLETIVLQYVNQYRQQLEGVPRCVEIKYRKMTSTWGVCRPTRQCVTFNKNLIHERLAFIEYVVVHELCHFMHPHHQRPFYEAVASVLPHYESCRRP